MGYIEDQRAAKEAELKNVISLFQEAEVKYESGDYKSAAEMFRLAATTFDLETEYNWGVAFYNGINGKPDYRRALLHFEKAAQQNYPVAEKALAIIYFNGVNGEAPNYEKSFYYAQKAAEHNNMDGYFVLGLLYYYGLFVEKDLVKAYEYLDKCTSDRWNATENDFTAHYIAGKICYYGEEIDVDYKNARKHLGALEYRRNNNASKYSEAMQLLGIIYMKGQGVTCDTLKAYDYFIESENAEENSESEYWLGILSLLSDELEKKAIGLEWLKKAADHGNSIAIYYYENEAERVRLLKELKTKLDESEINVFWKDTPCYHFTAYFPDDCVKYDYKCIFPKDLLNMTNNVAGRKELFLSEIKRLVSELEQYEVISLNSYMTRAVMQCTKKLMRRGKYQPSYVVGVKEHFLEGIIEFEEKFSENRNNLIFYKRIMETLLNESGRVALENIKSLIEKIISDYLYLLEFFYDIELMCWDNETEEIHLRLKRIALKTIRSWKKQVFLPICHSLDQILLQDGHEYVNFSILCASDMRELKIVEDLLSNMKHFHMARRLPCYQAHYNKLIFHL